MITDMQQAERQKHEEIFGIGFLQARIKKKIAKDYTSTEQKHKKEFLKSEQ